MTCKVTELAQRAESLAATDPQRSRALYTEAARLEESCLADIPENHPRTWSIRIVSTASLWFKAGDSSRAEDAALAGLASPRITAWGRVHLLDVLRAIRPTPPADPSDLVAVLVSAAASAIDSAPSERPEHAAQLAEMTSGLPVTRASVDALAAELVRMTSAVAMIRDGWISPSLSFAGLVLDGMGPIEAHAAERKRIFGQD